MSRRKSRSTESKRKAQKLTHGVVAYANNRYMLVNTDAQESVKIPLQRRTPKLLPGDEVVFEPARNRQNKARPAQIISCRRKTKHLVVGYIEFTPQANVLHVVGFIGIPNVYIQSKVSIPSGTYVLAEISPESRVKPESNWKLNKFIRTLKTECDLARGIAQARHGICEDNSSEIKKELKEISKEFSQFDLSDRTDLRHLPFITIDPAGAKDHDDAVYCKRLKSGARLYVAIADVAHFVRPDSAVDLKAKRSGTSIYFPGSAIHMLPSELSGDLCSLVPGQDRLAVMCEIKIDTDGNITHSSIYEAVINSAAKLTYTEAAKILEVGDSTPVGANLINLMYARYCLQKNQQRQNSLQLDVPEQRLLFDKNQRVKGVGKSHSTEMHSLIEEAMLAANICAAKFIAQHYSQAGMYRIHDVPSYDDTLRLHRKLEVFDVSFPSDRPPTLSDYENALQKLSVSQSVLNVLQLHILRSLSLAVYSESCSPHFALNFDCYTHFTSPIRRYPDLVVHRMIKDVIHHKKLQYSPSNLKKIARHCSYLERKAEACMREAQRWLIVDLMSTHINQQFDGVVTDVKSFGVFVQLEDPFVDGMVGVSELRDDYYIYDEHSYSLIGKHSGKTISFCSPLKVKVSNANKELGFIDFEIENHHARPLRRNSRKTRR